MSAISISFSLLIALFTILLLYRMRTLKPQIAGSDHKGCMWIDHISMMACCLECGQSLTAVTSILEK